MRKIQDREEAKRRRKESMRAAVSRYDKKYKRINCRMSLELYNQIVETGESVNSFIIKAIEERLQKEQKDTAPQD